MKSGVDEIAILSDRKYLELFDMFCKACRSTDKGIFVMFQIIRLKKVIDPYFLIIRRD